MDWRIELCIAGALVGPGLCEIASGETGHFTDAAVDAFGTYKYRINAGGKFSNEVTVGPPPAGVSNASPAPAGSQYEKYGAATAVALDENGDPAIAFEWNDPNGDGDAADTEIRFVRWDRATYLWTASVRVLTTGAIEEQGVHPIALAVDRASGTFAIFTPVGEGLAYALSTDRGATWKSTAVTNTTGTPAFGSHADRIGPDPYRGQRRRLSGLFNGAGAG